MVYTVYTGVHIHFFLELLASKPDGILTRLFAMGCLDESAELYKRTVKKVVCDLNISLSITTAFYLCYSY